MDIVYTYSHLGGEEILLVRFPEVYEQLKNIILQVENPGRNKKSKEKTKLDKQLYSPKEINQLFKNLFYHYGWGELKDFYDIEIPNYPHKIFGAYKQCDFYKEPVLVEVQFGKYAFMFYDLAKFQYFYNKGTIRLGVEIVPCHFLQRQMSSGVSYGEQLVYDLERLSKNFPSVPVNIILVDMPLESDDYHLSDRQRVRQVYEKVHQRINR
ncbi:MAG: restriction endonuclease [Candidatus Tectomicrobia bacterium]|nr:restriction endonuclease [Candidatus Tectomicrobia bacterium]